MGDEAVRTGLARRLAPEFVASLAAMSRVAHAVATASSLGELGHSALSEMRQVLNLEVVALYLPDADGRPVVSRYATAAAGQTRRSSVEEIGFDDEAWRLAVVGGVPLIFHEEGSWLVDNPFRPPATSWLVLPLVAEGRVHGIVIAAAPERIALDPTSATVLTMIGDLVSAGIATAQLRLELERVGLERERLRLAAVVHEGLAQDLGVAVRELALQDAASSAAVRAASRKRLHDAVISANAIVRRRLEELVAPLPTAGTWEAIVDICDRFRDRGLDIRTRRDGPDVRVPAEAHATVLRVLTEALANVERHASATTVHVVLAVEDARMSLRVADDGVGFSTADTPGAAAGHLGIMLMRERAEHASGSFGLFSNPGSGTTISLQVPI